MFSANREFAVAEIRISEDNDGVWTVYIPGLVVTDLTREEAEAFAASYRRITT
jgi:hypothetical protein